jgi:capsular polysaccharide biosynthesis protein
MNLLSVKSRLLRNSRLRSIGMRLWELGRDLPRRIRFQRVPMLQRWSGRPIDCHATVGEYLAKHRGRGWQKVIRPAGSYERVRPISLGRALPACFDPPQTVSWEDERVIFLESCRYWGGYGGSIITHDEHLLGELSPDVWGVERHTLFNKLKLPPALPLPGLTAVISTPEADRNYSHWMMELLPRLKLLAEAGYGPARVDRYLVNPGGASYERETLALAGLPSEKLLPVSAGSHFHCESIITTNLRSKHWQHSLPAWVPEYLRALTNLAPGASSSKRLYLTRRDASFRRVVNEEQLLPILRANDFEVFDPATRTVCEQATIFAGADAIVSPHSSGMTNLVFCRPGTAVMEIFAADYFDVSFWTAATSIGCRYSAVMGERVVQDVPRSVIEARRQDLVIPPELLASSLDAFSAGGHPTGGVPSSL